MDKMKCANAQTTLEEFGHCRAAGMGMQDFAECLCEGPNDCKYALPFGYAFLCQNPRVKEIVENTRKSMQAAVDD